MTFAELSAFCIHALTFFTAVETILFSFCNLMKLVWFEILYAGSGEKILQNIYKKSSCRFRQEPVSYYYFSTIILRGSVTDPLEAEY